ncbi:fibrous sheath CABYR-binding protein-like [Apis mellifera carnica]|nr:fibrous sheath CABYR-binding protein-like [Apis mellifera carnica]
MESSSRLVDPEEDGGRSMDNNAIVSEIVSEIVEESVSRQQESISVSRAASSREEEVRELIEEMIAPGEMAREEEEDATVLDPPPVPAVDAIVESEEGPVPVSSEQRNDEEEEEEEKEEEEKEEEEVLVEAKPALVIPEDEEVNEVSRVMETTTRDKLETETTDVAAPVVEEILISEMAEQEHDDDRRPRISARTIAEDSTKPADEARDDESCVTPPPAEPSSSSSLPLQSFPVEAFPEEQREELSIEKDIVVEASTDVPSNRQTHEAQEPRNPVSKLERAPSLADDFFPPPAPPEHHATEQQQVDCCFDYPLPPEHLSPPPLEEKPEPRNERPLLPNDGNKDDDNDDDSDARISTETATIAAIPLPPASTLPATPSPTSNASITSGLMPFTVDSSQSLLYDDQSNREFKMESVSISLNSYNESDIELKERLAESLAETEKQEESLVSCQLLNNATSSTTVQETHQSTPEQPEAPVENNVGHDVSTTESSTEPVKVTSPAVPSEVITASPPSAPAITEDVASVAKAIEEIDISDKAVAAATIECNTNEIIAEARYQNNINE